MEKPGSHNIERGALWLIVGTVLTIGSYWLLDWQGGVLFYGAIAVGGIQLVIGVFQRIAYSLRSPAKKAAAHADATVTSLLRCMAMVANADGTLDDREIEVMRAIFHRLTGSEVPSDAIRSITEKVGTGGSDPADFVASKGTQASQEHRIMIAKACYLVMRAVVVQPIPDFSTTSDSYTFPSTGEWPGPMNEGRVDGSQEEAPVHA